MRRPPRRQPASQQRNHRQGHRDNDECRRIARAHAHQKACKQTRSSEGGAQSHHDSDSDHDQALPQHHPENVLRFRAECHANPDFVGSPHRRIRHHAVYADNRQDQSQQSHRRRKLRPQVEEQIAVDALQIFFKVLIPESGNPGANSWSCAAICCSMPSGGTDVRT